MNADFWDFSENRRKADADGASGRLEDAIYRFGIEKEWFTLCECTMFCS